ncbi:class I SAM-dependent methyltransferase [Streptomyces sp. NPDC050388]|uniref:class I SAM-dependent methyltransferase n=1 Tax=Streptomyces sp. NPDC050388 TaxID=3155781 RepID=UPI003434CEC5
MKAFTDRWIENFSGKYDNETLGEITWVTGAVNPPVAELVVSLTIEPGARVIDLGCGAGVQSVFFAQHGYRVTGVDVSPQALKAARTLSGFYGVDVDWVEADVLETGLPAGEADLVHDSFIFHNIRPEARSAYVAEVARLLKPGGRMAVVGFSDHMVPGSGPIRLTSDDILSAFLPHFAVDELRRFRNFPTAKKPDQWHWFALLTRR